MSKTTNDGLTRSGV